MRLQPSIINIHGGFITFNPTFSAHKPMDAVTSYVHIFGANSSPSCANFCLQQTALDFAHLYDPTTLEIVRNNFYVDDCLFFVSSVEEAISAQRSLCELLRRRGLHLRKWLSNNE